MARKKPTEEAPAPPKDVFDEAIAAQQQLEPPAHEPEKPPEKKLYTRHESSAHDNVTGVEMGEFRSTEQKVYLGLLYFSKGNPGPTVTRYLRDNGFDFDKEGTMPAGKNFGTKNPWVIPPPTMPEQLAMHSTRRTTRSMICSDARKPTDEPSKEMAASLRMRPNLSDPEAPFATPACQAAFLAVFGFVRACQRKWYLPPQLPNPKDQVGRLRQVIFSKLKKGQLDTRRNALGHSCF
jgi:hypothetical protein